MGDVYEQAWGYGIQIRGADRDQNIDPVEPIYQRPRGSSGINSPDPGQKRDLDPVYEQPWGSEIPIRAPDPDQNVDPKGEVYEQACGSEIPIQDPDQNVDPEGEVYEQAWGSEIPIRPPDPDQNIDPEVQVYEQAWGSHFQIRGADPDQNIDPRLWIPLRERRGREGFGTTGRDENVGRPSRDRSPVLVFPAAPGAPEGGTSDAPDPGGPDLEPGGPDPVPGGPDLVPEGLDPIPEEPEPAPGEAEPVDLLNPLYVSDLPPGNVQDNTICGNGLSRGRLVCVAVATVVMVTLMTSVPFAVMMDHSNPKSAGAATILRTGHRPGWQTSQPAVPAPRVPVNPMPPHGEAGKPHPPNVPGPRRFTPATGRTSEEVLAGGVVKIRTYGFDPKESSPRGVEVSIHNEIFVTDSVKRLVQVYNMRGVHLRQYPTVLPGGAVMKPWDVSLSGDGHLWVVGTDDAHSEHVVQYARSGRLTSSFGIGNSLYINGIAADPRNDRVIVTCSDGYKGRLEIYHPGGHLLFSLGPEQRMAAPLFVTVSGEGTIVASDTRTFNVFVYAETGHFLAKFGGYPTSEDSRLYHPKGVCVTNTGDIVVADPGNRRLVVFTGRGRYLRQIATGMRGMQGVAAGPGGQLVVVDDRNRTVTIYPDY
ncbi:uncharacterized protein LOC144924187 [Branchiostoma floridae x Branchiostoma belcheri]